MTLIYQPGYVKNEHEIPHAILDVTASDFFHDPMAFFAKETAPTFAFLAKPDQKIVTTKADNGETPIVCKGGEVVFVTRLVDASFSVSIPCYRNGDPSGSDILEDNYKLVSGDLAGPFGALYVPSRPSDPIVYEGIKKPTVILDAFGPGKHQFLERNATLRIGTSYVIGIDKATFDASWDVTDENDNVLRPAKPPTPDFYSPQHFIRALHL